MVKSLNNKLKNLNELKSILSKKHESSQKIFGKHTNKIYKRMHTEIQNALKNQPDIFKIIYNRFIKEHRTRIEKSIKHLDTVNCMSFDKKCLEKKKITLQLKQIISKLNSNLSNSKPSTYIPSTYIPSNNNIDTIQKLNNWINTKIPQNLTENITPNANHSPTMFYDDLIKYFKIKNISYDQTVFNNYKTITKLNEYNQVANNGGRTNNCLIISFLTSVSENYRKVVNEKYYESYGYPIADEFRYKYLTKLYLFTQDQINKIKSTDYLDDKIIDILSNIYKIKILNLEGFKTENTNYMQPTVTSTFDYETGIIIYNIKNGHFESVYLQSNKQFTFTKAELDKLQFKLINTEPYPHYTKIHINNKNKYDTGTKVMYNNNMYFIKYGITIPINNNNITIAYILSQDNSKNQNLKQGDIGADIRYISLMGKTTKIKKFTTLSDRFANSYLESVLNKSNKNTLTYNAYNMALFSASEVNNDYFGISEDETNNIIGYVDNHKQTLFGLNTSTNNYKNAAKIFKEGIQKFIKKKNN